MFISDYTEGSAYSFSAFLLSKHSIAAGETLIFNTVQLNERGVYSVETGEYTVPANGTYLFFATLCTFPAKFADVNFVVNNMLFGTLRTGDASWHTCSSSSINPYLQGGTKVKLTLKRGSSGKIFYDERDHLQNSFSGLRIK